MKASDRVRDILHHIRKYDAEDAGRVVTMYNKHKIKFEDIKFYYCKDSNFDYNSMLCTPMVSKESVDQAIAQETVGFDVVGSMVLLEKTKKLHIYLK